MADSDSGQDRTLDPSAKRYEDARKEGQVPRSRDLAHLCVMGAAVAVLAVAGGTLATSSRALLERGMQFDAALAMEPGRMTERLGEIVGAAMLATAPLLATMLVAAVAAPLLVGGWLFQPNTVLPKLERLDLMTGLGRLFSTQSLVGLGKNLSLIHI